HIDNLNTKSHSLLLFKHFQAFPTDGCRKGLFLGYRAPGFGGYIDAGAIIGNGYHHPIPIRPPRYEDVYLTVFLLTIHPMDNSIFHKRLYEHRGNEPIAQLLLIDIMIVNTV